LLIIEKICSEVLLYPRILDTLFAKSFLAIPNSLFKTNKATSTISSGGINSIFLFIFSASLLSLIGHLFIFKSQKKSPFKTVEEVRNQPEQQKIKPEKKTVPIKDFEELRVKYEKLLKEKQELEDRLKNQPENTIKNVVLPKEPILPDEILKEPVKSDQPENTINQTRHSIVVKGWEIPVPIAIKIDESNIEKVKFAAVNSVRVLHKLDLQ